MRAGNQREVADAAQRAVVDHAVAGVLVDVVDVVLDEAQLLVGEDLEVVLVVLAGVEILVLGGGVAAGDVVKEEAVLGHLARRGIVGVALGVDVGVAAVVGAGAELLGDQHLQAVVQRPFLPVAVLVAEDGVAVVDADHARANRLAQILVHAAQQLQRLVHDRSDLLQAQALAQLHQGVDVDAGDGSGTQVDHDLAGITVVERIDQALPISLTHLNLLLLTDSVHVHGFDLNIAQLCKGQN